MKLCVSIYQSFLQQIFLGVCSRKQPRNGKSLFQVLQAHCTTAKLSPYECGSQIIILSKHLMLSFWGRLPSILMYLVMVIYASIFWDKNGLPPWPWNMCVCPYNPCSVQRLKKGEMPAMKSTWKMPSLIIFRWQVMPICTIVKYEIDSMKLCTNISFLFKVYMFTALV